MITTDQAKVLNGHIAGLLRTAKLFTEPKVFKFLLISQLALLNDLAIEAGDDVAAELGARRPTNQARRARARNAAIAAAMSDRS